MKTIPVIRCLVVVIAAWIAMGVQPTGAQQPIPAGPEAYTQADLVKELAEYEMRFAKAYQTHTVDPPNIRAAGYELIVASRKFWSNSAPPDVTRESLHQEAQRLIEAGSTDPLVLTIAAVINPKFTREKSLRDAMNRAETAMQSSAYGARQRADTAMRIYVTRVDLENKLPTRKRKYPELIPVMQTIAEWFAAEGQAKDDQRLIWLTAMDFVYQHLSASHSDTFVETLSRQTNIDPWLLNMYQGRMLAMKGWSVWNRDEEIARKETEQLLKQAAEHFLAAWKHNPKHPEPCVELLRIARRGLTDEQPRDWFDQAVKAQLDYKDAYVFYRDELRPDMNGSIEELYAFGLECANTKRYDTIVPFQLIEAMNTIEIFKENGLWRQPDVYEEVERLFEGAIASPLILGKPQTDESRAWLHASAIAVAVRADRYDATTKHWDRTTPAALRKAFGLYQVKSAPSILRSKVAAIDDGFELDLEKEITAVDGEEAAVRLRDRFKIAARKLPTEKYQSWINYWQTALDQYVSYHSGKWVTIDFVEDLPEQLGVEGWRTLDKHTLECRTPMQLPLDWLGKLNTPFEFSIEIEAKAFPTDGMLCGVMLGSDRKVFGHPRGKLFGFNPLRDFAGLMKAGEPGTGSVPHARLRNVNQIAVRAWPSYSEFFVNGDRVNRWHDSIHEHRFDPRGAFLLWTPGKEDSEVHVVYKNLRIRRLPTDRPWPDEEPPRGIELFTSYIDLDADNPYHYFDRGVAYYANHDFDEAIRDFRQALKLRKQWDIAQVRIGMCFSSLGEFDRAYDEFRKVIDRNENCHEALNRMAWLQATCPDDAYRDGEQAVKNAERAYKLNDTESGYRLAIIAALIEANRYDDAQAQLTKTHQRIGLNQNQQALRTKLAEAIGSRQPHRDLPPDSGSED